MNYLFIILLIFLIGLCNKFNFTEIIIFIMIGIIIHYMCCISGFNSWQKNKCFI